jgi:hypothetical protein
LFNLGEKEHGKCSEVKCNKLFALKGGKYEGKCLLGNFRIELCRNSTQGKKRSENQLTQHFQDGSLCKPIARQSSNLQLTSSSDSVQHLSIIYLGPTLATIQPQTGESLPLQDMNQIICTASRANSPSNVTSPLSGTNFRTWLRGSRLRQNQYL